MSVVRAYPIPLPTLAEQHRIVAKIDELMANFAPCAVSNENKNPDDMSS
jgi:restriction endonuclease S subunit